MQLHDLFEQPDVTDTPAFQRWFAGSKVVDQNGRPLKLYRGLRGDYINTLDRMEPRRGYAMFLSDSPYVAASYGNPTDWGDEPGAIFPVYVKCESLRDYKPMMGSCFDKFAFDQVASRLGAGQGIVARGVTDAGPRGNSEVDPERRYSERRDVYAFGRGTPMKAVYGNSGAFDPNAPTLHERDALMEDLWHGSPHKLTGFSTEHIGTGEGHMTYGWGLYFTDKKEIAEFYRTSLARRFTYKGRRVDPESWLHSVLYGWFYFKGDIEAARAQWKPTSNVYKLFDKVDFSKVRVHSYVYRVHVPDDSEFLLWDAPLTQQSPHVMAAVKALVQVPAEVEMFAKYEPGHAQDVWRAWDAYLRRKDDGQGLTGETLYWALAVQRRGEKAASLALLAAGVHGIKYLNGASRDHGQGDYNYVLFDGARATLLGREQAANPEMAGGA